jgi:hypothetical protein
VARQRRRQARLGPRTTRGRSCLPRARDRRRADATSAGRRPGAHAAVILLGDAPYYARFGFSSEKTAELSLPGPFERDRLLAIEFSAGALDGAEGMIVATGAILPKRRAARALQANAA